MGSEDVTVSIYRKVWNVTKTVFTSASVLITIILGYLTYAAHTSAEDEKSRQKDELKIAHTRAKDILATWNNIEAMTLMDKLAVEKIRETIEDVHKEYESQTVDKLSLATQISYMWHLAKLKIVYADMLSSVKKVDSLILAREARSLLQKAEELTRNKELTSDDKAYLSKNTMSFRIKRTELNALALALHLKDTSVKEEVEKLLIELNGCKQLKRESTRHVNIMKALGCTPA